MLSNLSKHFNKIGAALQIVTRADTTFTRVLTPVSIDVRNIRGQELFEIAIRDRDRDNIELSVLEVKPAERHLVLLSRGIAGDIAGDKEHFLCGHDERHLFVAAVGGVSTVAEAKASLKPLELRRREVGVNAEKANRRKTENFVRQGEWFFVPSQIRVDARWIRTNEPLVRGRGSKPHIAQFAFRDGGQPVKVCPQYPNGLTLEQFARLIKERPRTKSYPWVDMRRNAAVYVKGTIRHPDHATIVLDTWHRVLMNTERQTQTVAFLD
jgi:hypothetical protein